MSASILAVLEHPDTLKQISDCLDNVGHHVFQASDYHEAMNIIRQKEVDLIVCDVHLQNGGSIFDFMRWVKGDPHMHNVPFVCFSTEPVEVAKYLADGVRTAARAMGAAKYLTMEKFDPAVFRAEIEWLLPINYSGNYYADSNSKSGGTTLKLIDKNEKPADKS